MPSWVRFAKIAVQRRRPRRRRNILGRDRRGDDARRTCGNDDQQRTSVGWVWGRLQVGPVCLVDPACLVDTERRRHRRSTRHDSRGRATPRHSTRSHGRSRRRRYWHNHSPTLRRMRATLRTASGGSFRLLDRVPLQKSHGRSARVGNHRHAPLIQFRIDRDQDAPA